MYCPPGVAATSPAPNVSPPAFLALAGHPLRWRLLSELARSDRRVRELCELVSGSQALVSYHLGRLRAEGLVGMRRSASDGREAYYRVDLERCGELLAATGAALHPGLGRARHARPQRQPVRVLFLCTGNSARSQMAEALAQQIGGGSVEAFSAGSHPKPLHPNAVRVMRARGIDLSGRRSKHVDEFATRRFHAVISLCDRVREVCPELAGQPQLIHWSVADPARTGDDDEQTYPAFERTASELAQRIAFVLELLEEAA
jgi:ArsR family transcriptional regulator, arsenate/arsenite/antimonite-responsive transcriptional repressor / arsenate reductase (thioredoxin)